MTMQELHNNKPTIRRVNNTNGKTFSVNVPKNMAQKISLGKNDHMAIYLDESNRIILEKLKLEVNNQ
jgi:hypothetical protein